jgi:hypothetical protein
MLAKLCILNAPLMRAAGFFFRRVDICKYLLTSFQIALARSGEREPSC